VTRLPTSVWINGALLGLFGIVGSTLVALTHFGTAGQIARNEQETLLREIGKLVPPATRDNDILADRIEISDPELGRNPVTVYRARRNGQPVAVILSTVEAPGYAGPIRLIVGIRTDGSLGGVRVLSHRETPGLGDKIEEERTDWVRSFDNRSLGNPEQDKWRVRRDGGVFDQFTGATVTPRAVVTAVKRSLQYYERAGKTLFAPPAEAGS